MDRKSLKRKLEREMVDVCGGDMTLPQLGEEIIHYMLTYNPSDIVVTVNRNNRHSTKFYSSIYISKKDFGGGDIGR